MSATTSNDNANIRAAFIHILGDILQSVGVIIAAIIIKIWPHWTIIDPICTLIFAIIVTFTTYSVIKSCVYLLMESCPEEIHLGDVEEELNKIDGVTEVHDLHIWSLTHGKPAATAHVVGNNHPYILRKATLLMRQYGIYHSTIQIETVEQSRKGGKYYIDCAHNVH